MNPGLRRVLIALPLVVFAGLAVLFFSRLGAGDPSQLPSVLIGKPAPETKLPPLDGLLAGDTPVPGLDPALFKGKVTVVNVWASWCVPCRDEAAQLLKLAGSRRFRVVGINYKDETENARRFLGRYGNPYGEVGVDKNGRAAIDWGVYGVPETFVIGRDGTIVFKLVGPVTKQNLPALRREIEKVAGANSSS
jgi:cytochrome c biogenesis protein CcmG/thiol:disulfide interchange protein DsbE